MRARVPQKCISGFSRAKKAGYDLHRPIRAVALSDDELRPMSGDPHPGKSGPDCQGGMEKKRARVSVGTFSGDDASSRRSAVPSLPHLCGTASRGCAALRGLLEDVASRFQEWNRDVLDRKRGGSSDLGGGVKRDGGMDADHLAYGAPTGGRKASSHIRERDEQYHWKDQVMGILDDWKITRFLTGLGQLGAAVLPAVLGGIGKWWPGWVVVDRRQAQQAGFGDQVNSGIGEWPDSNCRFGGFGSAEAGYWPADAERHLAAKFNIRSISLEELAQQLPRGRPREPPTAKLHHDDDSRGRIAYLGGFAQISAKGRISRDLWH